MATIDNNTQWGRAAARGDLALAALVRGQRPQFTVSPWATATDTRVAGDVQLHFQYQQSYMDRSHPDRFKAIYSELVKRAHRKVVAYIPYVNPPAEFERALIETAQRGVDITLITNSDHTNDEAMARAVAKPYYPRLLRAGIKIHEYQPRTLHAKALLIDDSVVSIGSHNYTRQSFGWNGEANMMTGDPTVVAKFVRMVEHDLRETIRMSDVRTVQQRADDIGEQFWIIFARWIRAFI
jgi:phosphatidylserine/phosphatidylglycerophosphate/cardiolipin synthase-like enzyme